MSSRKRFSRNGTSPNRSVTRLGRLGEPEFSRRLGLPHSQRDTEIYHRNSRACVPDIQPQMKDHGYLFGVIVPSAERPCILRRGVLSQNVLDYVEHVVLEHRQEHAYTVDLLLYHELLW